MWRGYVGSKWSSFGGLFYNSLMDRFTLFVCLYTNGYISGWAISNQEPLRGVQYTPHVKRIKRKVFYMYSIAPHINEFSSSWRFFFLSCSWLNFVRCNWKKTVVFMGLWNVRKNVITFLFLSNLLLNPNQRSRK